MGRCFVSGLFRVFWGLPVLFVGCERSGCGFVMVVRSPPPPRSRSLVPPLSPRFVPPQLEPARCPLRLYLSPGFCGRLTVPGWILPLPTLPRSYVKTWRRGNIEGPE
ncbi:hypothetical protein BJ508DRAFT_418339 [Ascobolus immersus RN42]|uniref:Secreted protein n=1 Tax=Ascobolus immersus RN42 TaxID=1160509 RepID=A0A3N4HR95_ASCIM|nr:hypothetical protein BJ508DRAFT_418339 [Ascobolus immersus RN42]